MPLHIMGISDDPLLDESLEFARRWNGKKRVYITEGVAHGAFLYNYFSREGSRCVPLTAEIVRNAFQD